MSVSFFMLFRYNRYHHAVYSGITNEITGNISRKFNTIEYYFQLKRTNDSLVKANETLYNKLKQDFEIPDTATRVAIDTINTDSLQPQRKYLYMQAKVIHNSVSQPNNYIELHRGSKQGVQPDMGVIDVNNSIVGTVMEVSDNYSVVMSLLHEQSFLSARLKKSGEAGTVIWEGRAPDILTLKDVSKSVKISSGDTVITSGMSDRFPPGLLIGVVKEIVNDKTSSTYIVRIKTAANFQNLQYAYIINNLQQDEPGQLLKKVTSK